MSQARRAALAAMGVVEWVPRASPVMPAPAAEDAAQAPQPMPYPVAPAPVVDVPAGALDWEALAAAVARCERCALAAGRTQTVFGVGNRNAEWMIIGEAPGQEEDRQGEPFVGRAGQLLNAMLESVGLSRPQVFIANILKCRPPANRDPEPAEAAACSAWARSSARAAASAASATRSSAGSEPAGAATVRAFPDAAAADARSVSPIATSSGASRRTTGARSTSVPTSSGYCARPRRVIRSAPAT